MKELEPRPLPEALALAETLLAHAERDPQRRVDVSHQLFDIGIVRPLRAAASVKEVVDADLQQLAKRIAEDWNGRIDVDRLARAMTEATPLGPGIYAEAEAVAREYARLSDPSAVGSAVDDAC